VIRVLAPTESGQRPGAREPEASLHLSLAARPNHSLPCPTLNKHTQRHIARRKRAGKQPHPTEGRLPARTQATHAKSGRAGEGRERMARGLRGVRDDLSELGRHLLDIACFLHPLLNPAHTDSPPATPTHRRRAARRSPSPPPATAAAAQVADDVVGAPRALAARPEAWIDFPVLALDESE
jgi:hypothetical protein